MFPPKGTALLTVDQRRWHDLKARLKMAQPLHIPPKPSESATFRRTLYELTMSRPFNQFFAALVVLNSATLIFPWNVEEEEEKNEFLYIVTALSAVLNMLFAVEVNISFKLPNGRITISKIKIKSESRIQQNYRKYREELI
jgi:sodium leak channel non-selective protein